MKRDTRSPRIRAVIGASLVGAVVGGAVAFGAASAAAPVYVSDAELTWDPAALKYSDVAAYVPDSVLYGIGLKSQVADVLSDDVVGPAADKLSLSPGELRDAVAVTAASSSARITISASATSPARAKAVVDEVVSEYSSQITTTLSEEYTRLARNLTDPISQLKKEQALATNASLSDNIAGQVGALLAQRTVLTAQAKAPQSPLSVIHVATLPRVASGPVASTWAVVGAGLGLLAGVVLSAALRGRLRQPLGPRRTTPPSRLPGPETA